MSLKITPFNRPCRPTTSLLVCLLAKMCVCDDGGHFEHQHTLQMMQRRPITASTVVQAVV